MNPVRLDSPGVEWPRLRVDDWVETRDTLHLWMQIIGKIRLAHAPMLNHWWQVPLYVTPRGLTTSAIPYGEGAFDIEFDFCDHHVYIRSSIGTTASVALHPMSVADFHAEIFAALDRLGIYTTIRRVPVEVDPAIPFTEDRQHASYDGDAAYAFWCQLLQADRVLNQFRSRFIGKVSPVHLFWGSMDLACTRFSGRTAPTHPGGAPNCGDWVMVEGYSHELSSCGFWPGGSAEGSFYSYAYPEPEGYSTYPLDVEDAFYSREFKQFLLPYAAVRAAKDPDRELLRFMQGAYVAAAECGRWDRAALEVDPDRWLEHRRGRPQRR